MYAVVQTGSRIARLLCGRTRSTVWAETSEADKPPAASNAAARILRRVFMGAFRWGEAVPMHDACPPTVAIVRRAAAAAHPGQTPGAPRRGALPPRFGRVPGDA